MKLCTLFLIALWMAIACPRVLASTTTKATFDGTYTVINVTWIDDGLDGGRSRSMAISWDAFWLCPCRG